MAKEYFQKRNINQDLDNKYNIKGLNEFECYYVKGLNEFECYYVRSLFHEESTDTLIHSMFTTPKISKHV